MEVKLPEIVATGAQPPHPSLTVSAAGIGVACISELLHQRAKVAVPRDVDQHYREWIKETPHDQIAAIASGVQRLGIPRQGPLGIPGEALGITNALAYWTNLEADARQDICAAVPRSLWADSLGDVTVINKNEARLRARHVVRAMDHGKPCCVVEFLGDLKYYLATGNSSAVALLITLVPAQGQPAVAVATTAGVAAADYTGGFRRVLNSQDTYVDLPADSREWLQLPEHFVISAAAAGAYPKASECAGARQSECVAADIVNGVLPGNIPIGVYERSASSGPALALIAKVTGFRVQPLDRSQYSCSWELTQSLVQGLRSGRATFPAFMIGTDELAMQRLHNRLCA